MEWLVLATHVPSSGLGGGIIRYTVECIRALDRRDDVNCSVVCLPEAGDFFRDLLGPDRVQTAPTRSVLSTSLYERTVLGTKLRNFDVVHGTKHLVPPRLPGVTARRLLTVHDMILLDRPRDFPRPKRLLLREPYLASIKQADTLLCVSKATRHRLLSYDSSSAGRSHVVPLAYTNTLNREPEPVPALSGTRYALVVGDDSARKNLPMLAQAMKLARQQVPDAVLAVVGPQSWATTGGGATLHRLASEGVVQNLGFLPESQLRWCYENAAVVCCPSVLEGYGLPAMEARAFGRPLITSDDPALIEVSGEGIPHLRSDDPQLWADHLVRGLRGELPPASPAPPRTWDDVAAETLEAARHG